jgi:hypothetical protein
MAGAAGGWARREMGTKRKRKHVRKNNQENRGDGMGDWDGRGQGRGHESGDEKQGGGSNWGVGGREKGCG